MFLRCCKRCYKEFSCKSPNSFFCSVRCRFLAKVEVNHDTGCWVWTSGKDEEGRAKFKIGEKSDRAARVAYELFIEPIPQGTNHMDTVVRHNCEVWGFGPACVNPDHLELGSQTDNVADMDRRGRRRKYLSETCPKTKLSKHHVRKIRQLWAKNKNKPRKHRYKRREVAAAFNVSESTVKDIVSNRTWVDV
jgi:hypothetical protein